MKLRETRSAIRATIIGTAAMMATFMVETLFLAEWPWWAWGIGIGVCGIALGTSETLFSRVERRRGRRLVLEVLEKEEQRLERERALTLLLRHFGEPPAEQ